MSKVDNVWYRFDDQDNCPVVESFKESGDVKYRVLIFEQFDASILKDKSKKSSSPLTKITNASDETNSDSDLSDLMDVDDEYNSTRIQRVVQKGVNKLDPQNLYTRSQ